jgi:uncharacterized damage-inducible protein DinB
MDLLDRLLGHDASTTRQLLDIAGGLGDEALDREFDIGHRTLRKTFDHIIHNMEVWSSLMAGEPVARQADGTVPGLIARLDVAAARLQRIARAVADREGWDETWTDVLDDPPTEKSYGTALAHLLTHSMHHRAQVLYLLRLCGARELPEGDVFSWENGNAASPASPHVI